jgi:outer membrane protein OmpA-like peptidoglycan-associated protein
MSRSLNNTPLVQILKTAGVVAVLISFCFGHRVELSSREGPANPSGAAQREEDIAIPPDAQEKASQALKALGPTRGAKKIDYKAVKIMGISRAVTASRVEIQKALRDLGARETKTEIQIDLPGDILFDFDKWDIRPDAGPALKKVGTVIQESKTAKVTIAGHTDSKGADDYNQVLSKKRADAVKDWLVVNSGAKPDLLTTVGYGETKPIAPNSNPDGSDNPEGRQKNRRVEIVIKK